MTTTAPRFGATRSAGALTTAAALLLSTLLLLLILGPTPVSAQPTAFAGSAAAPFQSTGIKIGEVDDKSAIIWTRLTRREDRGHEGPSNLDVGARKKKQRKKKKVKTDRGPVEDQDLDEWVSWPMALEESAPGSLGFVRVVYRPADKAGSSSSGSVTTRWMPVNENADYTYQFKLRNLTPNTRYKVAVESKSRSGMPGVTINGGFRTAPLSNDDESRIVFTVASCTPKVPDHDDGYRIYPQMQKLDPNFFVHTGDIVYYDRLAKTVDIARHHWHWAYTYPTNTNFHRQVSSYFMKDDHDTWQDDCYPGMESLEMEYFTFKQGQALFREQVPMGDRTYRTARWGKHLQVWMVEGRDFRSPNYAKDGPQKTIWGRDQMDWFTDTVKRSDATFRVLISPTPVVGPDRYNHMDNHSNRAFKYEGGNLRRFLAQHNMIVICGDRHWQYKSVHNNLALPEYSVGPTTDAHTGNFGKSDIDDGDKDAHRYMNGTSGGFFSATVDVVEATPSMTLRFHGVMGNINYEDVLFAETEDIQDEPAEIEDIQDEPAEIEDEPAEIENIQDEPAEIEDEPAELEDIQDEPADVQDEPADIEDEPAEIEDEPAEEESDPNSGARDTPRRRRNRPPEEKREDLFGRNPRV